MMADEEKNDQGAEEQEQPVDETPAEEPQAAEESSEEALAADEGDSGGDQPADAPESTEDEGDSGDDEPAAAAGGDEDVAPPTPKEIRKLARSSVDGPAEAPRSGEERAVERAERRTVAAASRRRARVRARKKRSDGAGMGTPPAERESAAAKSRVGTVVSDRADKTITVRIERARRHPTYEKIVRRTNTLHAHDERNDAREGDVVRVVETRPLSKTKRWRLDEIVERAQ